MCYKKKNIQLLGKGLIVSAINDMITNLGMGCAPKSQKHRQILVAAYEEFIGRGFGDTSMDQIARTANVSKATLYAYFPSKEDLFAAIIPSKCQEATDRLGEVDLETDDPETILRQLGKALMNILVAPEGIAMFKLVVAEAHRFPELSRIFFDTGPKVIKERIVYVFTRLEKRGVLVMESPETAGIQFLSLLKGHLHTRLILGLIPAATEDEINQLVETTVSLILRAYAPKQALQR